MIALIVLIPLIAAMIGIAFLKDQLKLRYIAIIGSFLALLAVVLVSYGTTVIPWLSLGSSTINFTIQVTPLNFMLLVLVLLIGALVMVYSAGYIAAPSEQRRFYLEILAFETAMATFAMSGNFITLFTAWEFLSLTSYMLIGFWYNKDNANRAARKALTIIFIGDLALLSSIILFWNVFGTLEFTSILAALSATASPTFYAATILLLVAIFTKSAQFPFHEWLIDAMEGPTPVSAYLHSSTMVKAGVFAAIVLFPIFMSAGVLPIILIFGLVTTVIATLAACRELHIKKVIAYSTIQELSIMFIGLGSGAVLATIFFFFIQTFYKALLFFSAGNIMEATESDYINQAQGLKSNKVIYATTLVGVLSLAGVIPFSGFFANEVLSTAFLSFNTFVYFLMSGISVLTSFYIFRWFFYVAKPPEKLSAVNRYKTQPKTMVYPMVVLAILTTTVSIFGFYIYNFLSFGNYLQSLTSSTINIDPDLADSALFMVLISIGVVLSYLAYTKKRINVSLSKIDVILYTNPIVNFIYKVFARFVYEIGEAAALIDSYVNDIFDKVGSLTLQSGQAIKRASVGDINFYALIVIIGIVVLIAMFYALVL